MCKPSVPNPNDVARAQSQANIDAAIASAWLNNADTTTPFGAVDYTQTGTKKYHPGGDTSVTIDIPTFSARQTLSPDQQRLLDLQEQAGINLGTMARDQSARINQLLSDPYNPNKAGLPSIAGNAPNAPNLLGFGNNITPGLDTQIGTNNFEQARKNVEDALYSRINPELERDRSAMEQRLANQGITSGSTAWNESMDAHGRKENDARMQTVLAGGQEQSRLWNQEQQQAQFGNQALQQDYQNQLGFREFNNQVGTQNFNLQNQNMINQSNLRQQALQEDLAIRNQPISEISALMSGSQPTIPQFQPFQGSQIQPAQIGQYMYQSAGMQNQGSNAAMGGLFGLGSSLMSALPWMFSDLRLKHDIRKVGKLDNGLDVYAYTMGGVPQIGLIAQEVEKVKPEAVKEIGGFKAVRYDLAVEA